MTATERPDPHGGLLTDGIEAVPAEKQAEIIREYDSESNFRKLAGPVGLFVTTIAVILSGFHIYTAGFGLLVEIKHRAFHLALVLGLVFLVFPRPRMPRDAVQAAKAWGWSVVFTAFYLYLAWALLERLTAQGEVRHGWAFVALVGFVAFISLPLPQFGGTGDRTSWVDWPLAATAAAASLYFIVFFDDVFIARVGAPVAQDYMMGVLAIVIVMEATRRTMGPLLPVLGMACLLYALLGRHMPGILGHRGYSVDRVVNHIYVGTEGIYGIAVGVVATYVFHFVLFGILAQMTGLGRLFMDLATVLAGRYSGGPAKVSVVSSGMFGMISGSAIANAVTTGSLTIPMMKKYGFSPRFAGAVEASASCGGQVTPPVMGASAFVMAELLGVPYKLLVIVAIVPALFHYFACLTMVHLEAKRLKLKGVEPHLIPRLSRVVGESWHLVFPLIALVTMLLLDFTPFLAAFWGIILCFVSSYIPLVARRLGWGKLQGQTLTWGPLIEGLSVGAKYALAIGAACACVGLILGTLTLSGLGFKFSGAVIDLAGIVGDLIRSFDPTGLVTENGAKVFFGLLFVAIACIMMGTGVPTTPTYIILASIAAPALATLGVPLLATHFFVFYYGVLADVTPPVALAAYAAAGIAGAEPMRTGMTAFRLSMGKALVPFMFTYTPALLFVDFTWGAFVSAAVAGAIGVLALAAAYTRWWAMTVTRIEQVVLTAGGLILVFNQLWLNVIGISVVAITLGMNTLRARR
ncbi:Sialic acid TRAP transporter permease protein SiaT [Burkholderiales bacterium]|nr:Sialic acid TRAP transporter permease protein SiaT [Burkholderiales bacterium]